MCGLPNPGAEEKAPRSLAADARVIGGVPLARNEFPWLAGLALWWKSTPDCGAALISNRSYYFFNTKKHPLITFYLLLVKLLF